MKEKTLYFEEVGSVSESSNGLSCRIRTVFTNDRGEKVYLEIHSGRREQLLKYDPQYFLEHEKIAAVYLHIVSAFIISDEIDDENIHNRKCIYLKPISFNESVQTPYTVENILNVVNTHFNCSFDKVCIPPSLAGYRVKKEYSSKALHSELYNYGDEFSYNEELTLKMLEKVNELKNHFKNIFSQQYDNTSYWNENGKLVVQLNVSKEKRLAAGYSERKFVVEV